MQHLPRKRTETICKNNQTKHTESNEKAISLSMLCEELSISTATGRNWIRLGKIVPSFMRNRTPFFSPNYVEQLKASLQSSSSTMLKSRRNKNYVSGNILYHSYVSAHSVNIIVVETLLNALQNVGITVDESVLCTLVAECATQLLSKKYLSDRNIIKTNCLSAFLSGNLPLGRYAFLIRDLLPDRDFTIQFLQKYPELFTFEYTYETHEDILGLLYLTLKNLGSRKATGSYYTPTNIVKKLCNRLFEKNEPLGKDILDPCCGTGNFLLQLPQDISFEHVYGNDIDRISVQITRINMALKYNIDDEALLYNHITRTDYLNQPSKKKYDFIIGNPPWGYDYSEAEKLALRRNYQSAIGSGIESYDIFIEQALSHLTSGGVLSFVLPEAVYNVRTHTPIRRLIMQKNSLQYIEFLGNVFDKVQCPCIILQIIHNNRPFSTIGLTVQHGQCSFSINTERFVSPDCFSFMADDEEYAVLEKIADKKLTTTLKGKATFALGIVTGNNKSYLSKVKTPENEIVLKGTDIHKYRYQPSGHYLSFHPELFQQSASEAYYRAPEKLLYRFICNQLVFAYDNHGTLSLNSCNILIPAIEGMDIKYIMAILNSRIAQFYFQKQFHSVKVLRSHIEQIPIPYAKKETQKRIIQLVDSFSAVSDQSVKLQIYNNLDTIIADLFNLTEKEYQLIKDSVSGKNFL